ncbi:acyl-CoA dehydrogenase [Zavarzinia sp. CC-PAN008]|uniref:acyl-CoA dehydrogenase n=1 Tax=Zavarzinia sp. CC-PAN008 TaxID=3243332 RepID=UPI003F74A3C4
MTELTDWIGRRMERDDVPSAFDANALVATLGVKRPEFRDGDPLPPMWHWMSFLDAAPRQKIGPDGHAERGDFLPPIELPRRMFAGADTTFLAPLVIGETARMEIEVVSVQEKTGRTGRLVLLGVERRMSCRGQLAVVEKQTAVYREAGAGATTPDQAPADAEWSWEVPVDPVMLFRFSALTFNGHRIHYDRPYTTGVEHYPGLVVHGPLIAISLLESLHQAGQPAPASFSFRAVAPLFDDAPFQAQGRRTDAGASLWAKGPDGRLAMRADVTF